ncbi:nitrogenase [Leptolyngbya sp. 'hensonii']|uniref:Mo-dependent nitrogenase C-terminal domain-containing protein n=1 Tax=Leptolyngbya sp. 'hensonii' TaxID=1922337 RepID=UPI00094FDDC2|nr:Mo-dependent nitrogenase C-terminal domain-containing protein [Leptolyngbya sp. 'hensonii']OLP16483.1 nitrogenase [Leptolyngbya sp. 'hensonii']
MGSNTTSSLSDEQITVWLRGLLTLAWSDGDFSAEEQSLITDLTHSDLGTEAVQVPLEPISAGELAAALGKDKKIGEDFLRTAVMVAIADGTYSTCEHELVNQFCDALGLKLDFLQALEQTLYQPETGAPVGESSLIAASPLSLPQSEAKPQPLKPLQDWLDEMDIHDPRVARFLCKMIPPQCPFERDITLFGRKVVHIPPLCKLNPLYEQLVGLRFRSLSYLADDCGEDVSPYC